MQQRQPGCSRGTCLIATLPGAHVHIHVHKLRQRAVVLLCQMLSEMCLVMLWSVGHEADARVLQQQLSSLLAEQEAAQQFITDNPPPEVSTQQKQQQHQTQNATAKQGAASVVDWKWDILRPVTLPSPPG